MKASTIFIFFCMVLCYKVQGQSLDNYNDVLIPRKIGETITKRSGKDISQRTYLGAIRNKKGAIKYYVVKDFLRFKTAIIYHGHSSILFFNKKFRRVVSYNVAMPCGLPYKLLDNTLFFHNCDSKEVEQVKLGADLPVMLCADTTGGCYERE